VKTIVAVALALIATACTPATPAKPSPSTDVPQNPALIARFTNVIWPTIITYRYYGQGDPQNPPGPDSSMAKFQSVIDVGSATGSVKHNAQDLPHDPNGRVQHYALENATISSLSATDADIVACYTYDFTAYLPYPQPDPPPVRRASEVTFVLHKSDDWLVRDITNDHVVPSCSNSKA
jgi:hypothetical protein